MKYFYVLIFITIELHILSQSSLSLFIFLLLSYFRWYLRFFLDANQLLPVVKRHHVAMVTHHNSSPKVNKKVRTEILQSTQHPEPEGILVQTCDSSDQNYYEQTCRKRTELNYMNERHRASPTWSFSSKLPFILLLLLNYAINLNTFTFVIQLLLQTG